MTKMQFMRLWDLYGKLLSPTKQEITELYFNYDLTITEIAEQKGVSRQSVSECLGICKRELEEFEQKLGHERLITEGELRFSLMQTSAERWARAFEDAHPEARGDLAALRAVLFDDYSERIEAEIEKMKERGE